MSDGGNKRMVARLTRKSFLTGLATGVGTVLLAACGQAASTAAPSKPAEAPAAKPSGSAEAKPAAAAEPTKPAAAAPTTAAAPAAAKPTEAPAAAAKPAEATKPAVAAAAAPKPSGPRAITFMSTGNEGEQKMFQDALAAIKPKMDAEKITITWNPDPGGGWNKIMSMFA